MSGFDSSTPISWTRRRLNRRFKRLSRTRSIIWHESHVRVSFDIPEHTGDVTGLGAVRDLEAIRKSCESARFYQASSSELYGNAVETPQRETTPFAPRNPYAVAKAYAFFITKNYREAYDMFAVNGILFNHESPAPG